MIENRLGMIVERLERSDQVGEFHWDYPAVNPDFGVSMLRLRPKNTKGAAVEVLDTTESIFVSVARRWEVDSSDKFVAREREVDWAVEIVLAVAQNGMECWAPVFLPLPFFGESTILGFDGEPRRSWRARVGRWNPW